MVEAGFLVVTIDTRGMAGRFDCQKCQKLTLGGYLGLSLSQKSILRALSCLYIPIYTHAQVLCTHIYPYISICTHIYPYGPIYTHIYPYIPIYTHIYLHIYPYIPIYIHMYPICTLYIPHMYPYIPLAGGRAGGRTNCCGTHTHFRNLWVLDIPIYGNI